MLVQLRTRSADDAGANAEGGRRARHLQLGKPAALSNLVHQHLLGSGSGVRYSSGVQRAGVGNA